MPSRPLARPHAATSSSAPPRSSVRRFVRRLTAPGVALVLAASMVPIGTPSHAAHTAAGAEFAAATSGAPLRAVGLGDSVPQGGHCDCTPYVERAARAIASRQDRPFSVVNWAASGFDSGDLDRQLRWPGVQRWIARTELAIVQVGANDFDESRVAACRNTIDACYGADLRALRTSLTRQLRTIYTLQRNARAEVLAVGYWNVFRDGAVGQARGAAYVTGSERLTRRVNAVIAAAARDAGAIYIDGYAPFKDDGSRDATPLLADDGDHPNADGHEVLARSLVRQLGAVADQL